MDAPFMALLCEALPDALEGEEDFSRRIREWPIRAGAANADALVLRVTGALNAARRAGKLRQLGSFYPPAALPARSDLVRVLRAAIAEGDACLTPWLGSAPQTNEVGRSGALMPGLMVIAARTGLPLRLFEIGASAGLNLRLDDYGYDLGGQRAGRIESPVQLKPLWQGAPPPAQKVHIRERRGVDLNPLDVTDADTRARLLAYVWPDQQARVERLEAALDLAAFDPPPLDRGDGAEWVERHLRLNEGAATVLMHSVALQYFPRTSQNRIVAQMRRIGQVASQAAPLAWLSYEMVEVGKPMQLRLTLWPDGTEMLLAHVHPHGSEITWLADTD